MKRRHKTDTVTVLQACIALRSCIAVITLTEVAEGRSVGGRTRLSHHALAAIS